MINAAEALELYRKSKARKERLLSEIENAITDAAASQRFCIYTFYDCSQSLVDEIIGELKQLEYTITAEDVHVIKIRF